MNRKVWLAVMVLFYSAGLTQAQEKLGVTFGLSYHSKWLSKGVEAYGQQGALFTTLDLDLYNTGFGFMVIHRNATSSGYVDQQRADYRPYYKGTVFEDTPYQMNFNLSTEYENYYGLDRRHSNTTWEWIFKFTWPNLLPYGLVPTYIYHYEYGAGRCYTKPSGAGIEPGGVHRFILGYDVNLAPLPQALHLSSELAYTDGLGNAAHDWSYATFGLSTNFQIDENLSFSPGVFQQITMDDSVSKRKDITYCILTMKYKF